jgi:hypothetical protein
MLKIDFAGPSLFIKSKYRNKGNIKKDTNVKLYGGRETESKPPSKRAKKYLLMLPKKLCIS